MQTKVLSATADHASVIIQSPDTDVAILISLFHFEELWFRTKTKDKAILIPLHEIHALLGPLMCSAILGLYALSGCDITSSLRYRERKGFEACQDFNKEALSTSVTFIPGFVMSVD